MYRHLRSLSASRALGLSLLTFTAAGIVSAVNPPAVPLRYPPTTKTDVVDDYHGTKVADPYRWLEDDNSAETKAWVEAQNKVAFGYLETLPLRAPLKARLTALYDFERYGVPFKQGGRYFFSKNNGLQNQSVLHVAATLDATPRVLLDPNTLSADGTVALKGYAVSTTARTSRTAFRRPDPIGRNGGSATWPPARTRPTC